MTAEAHRHQRGHDFYPPAEVLAGIPALYSTENVPPADKVIHLHYFVRSCDWWLAEYDPPARLGWGYACLGDPDCAEWGNVSLPELESLYQEGHLELDERGRPVRFFPTLIVERDLFWTTRRAKEVSLPGRPF